jgi:death-on-curing protein
VAAVVSYGLNDETLEAPDDDAYDLVIAVAGGQLDYQAAAQLLARWH